MVEEGKPSVQGHGRNANPEMVVFWTFVLTPPKPDTFLRQAPIRVRADRGRPDGRAYLEVHHVKRLAEGGEDGPENTLALCPSCHREAHYGRASRVRREFRKLVRREPRWPEEHLRCRGRCAGGLARRQTARDDWQPRRSTGALKACYRVWNPLMAEELAVCPTLAVVWNVDSEREKAMVPKPYVPASAKRAIAYLDGRPVWQSIGPSSIRASNSSSWGGLSVGKPAAKCKRGLISAVLNEHSPSVGAA